jgi:hypothetical protein
MESTFDKFDTDKCKTLGVFGCDVYWCLASRSNQLHCRHIMSFGRSYVCWHPDRSKFAEREQQGLDPETRTSKSPV